MKPPNTRSRSGPSGRTLRSMLLLCLTATTFVAFPPATSDVRAREQEYPYRTWVPQTASDGVVALPDESAPALESCRTEPGILPFDYTPSPSWDEFAALGRLRYRLTGIDYRPELANYSVTGDYLNWGAFKQYREGGELRFDGNGIPMININGDGTYVYQPTTIAQYALTLHGRYLRGTGTLEEFTNVADFLLTQQDWRGAFRLNFPFYYYRMDRFFSPGWVSALTQAQALSVMARAWLVTGDTRYLEAGDRALDFLITPSDQGGVLTSLGTLHPELADYAFFKTFPGIPTAFTLNGMLFTMLGLYDWWQLDPAQTEGPSAIAGGWFRCSMATVQLILPLYDLDGFSSYDLAPILTGAIPNAQPAYHGFHISVLHALVSVTGNSTLEAWENRWRADVDGPSATSSAGAPGPSATLPPPPPSVTATEVPALTPTGTPTATLTTVPTATPTPSPTPTMPAPTPAASATTTAPPAPATTAPPSPEEPSDAE